MRTKYLSVGILGIAFVSSSLVAQYKPFESSAEQTKYSYQYFDINLGKKIKGIKTEKEAESLLKAELKKLELKNQGLEQVEKALVIGILLKKLGKNNAAMELFLDIAKSNIGNKLGEFALWHVSDSLLNKIHQPESRFIKFFSTYEFSKLHPEVQSMVSYFKSKHFLEIGFKDWIKAEVTQMQDTSPWSLRLAYRSLKGEILNKGVDFPFDSLQKFYRENFEKLGKLDQSDLYLNSARFLFEQGAFEKAFEVYKDYELYTERLRGQIMLEMAWSKYYQQEYSHSLGLLKLLEAPYFDLSRSTDRYVLEALIYRQLCHYELVTQVQMKLIVDLGSSINKISNRFGHSKDVALVQLTLMEESLAIYAEELSALGEELEYLKTLNGSKSLVDLTKKRLNTIEAKLAVKVEEKLPKVMENLLKVQQEMSYLSYISGLDQIRSSQPTKKYESEKIQKYKFDKLFWKTNGEFWKDELDDYRVLIDSKCGGDSK